MRRLPNKGTILRTSVLALAFVNQGLMLFGKSILPITEDQLIQGISFAFTFGTALWSWWKNNSFTGKAMQADEYLKSLNN